MAFRFDSVGGAPLYCRIFLFLCSWCIFRAVNFRLHPSELLDFYREAAGPTLHFEFSKYVYRPRSLVDEREYFTLPAAQARHAFSALVSGLGPEEDLAFHSSLRLSNNTLHIPMLDLAAAAEETNVGAIGQVMHEFGIKEFALYKTGRSAHVYGLGTLSSAELLRFFGRALLLNLPGQAPVVDARWIGHRVMSGYGSLRWSCNGPQYLQAPELLGRYRT